MQNGRIRQVWTHVYTLRTMAITTVYKWGGVTGIRVRAILSPIMWTMRIECEVNALFNMDAENLERPAGYHHP